MTAPRIEAVWTDLDALAPRLGALAAHLSADELARAGRLRFARDRARFIARRGWLREQLALRLRETPGGLRFEIGRFGKPALAGARFGFNASSAGGVALLAIGEAGEIGCDIAWRDPELDAESVAGLVFSVRERAALAALPQAQRQLGFFHGWTRKEAFIKALGEGFARPGDSFDVELDPARPPALLRGCEGWSVAAFEPVAGFQAAVVARGAWRLERASS